MASFNKAVRAKTKLKMALTGVSGAGKTLGALMIAYGMTEDWDKVAVIDTEHESALRFANRKEYGIGQFLHAPMEPPYSPERYIELVKAGAEIVGPDGVVIIDSFSHAWSNEGGVLDIKDKIAARHGMNSYTAWNEAGRVQNNLVNTILATNCHMIITMRSKMDYALQENERGKMQPVKLGLAPVQRDDVEYEFDVVLDIGRNHVATASKDRTFLDKYGEVITAELGRVLKAWLDEGVEVPRKPSASPVLTEKPIGADEWSRLNQASGRNKEIMTAMLKHFGAGKASDLKMGQMEEAMTYIRQCMETGGVPYEDSPV